MIRWSSASCHCECSAAIQGLRKGHALDRNAYGSR